MNIFKLFGRKGFHVFTAVTIITGANGFAESGGKVWQKYVNFRQANNDLSTWTGSAKTTDLFPGIPVGVAYDISITCQLSSDHTKILETHQWTTKDGRILSTGSGFVTYDSKRKKIFSSYSGFDQGEPFSTLIDIVKFGTNEEKREHTETLKGKTYNYSANFKWDRKTGRKTITHVGSDKDKEALKVVLVAENHGSSQEDKDIEEVTATVLKMYDLVNNKKHWSPINSENGSYQFWSSGGLLNHVTPELEKNLPAIESNSIQPKHITVVPVKAGKVAVAMFYAEGAEKMKGRPAVDHYMTRATLVFAKENGEWRFRAAHWSPITGGQGTSTNSTKK